MKRMAILVLVGVFLTTAVVPVFGQDISNAEKAKIYVQKGKEFLAKGDGRNAAGCFQKALELDPKNLDALIHFGIILRLSQNWGGAAAKFQEATKINPKHQQAQYYFGSTLMKLGRYEPACKALKAAYEAEEGHFQDDLHRVLVPYEYGMALARLEKGQKAAEVLRSLADSGKFEGFGALAGKSEHYKVYWEGYQAIGEAYMAMGAYAEADKYLTRMKNNFKQLHEGKLSREVANIYTFNKYRVPKSTLGQIQDNLFFNPKCKIKIKKPKGWDFIFQYPECYEGHPQADQLYKQNSQAECAAIWLIERNAEGNFEAKVDVTLEAWPLNVSLTMGETAVSLSSPGDVCEAKLENYKKYYNIYQNRRERVRFYPPRKYKLNGMRAEFWKGTFQHKEHENVKRDIEFWCFISTENSFFLELSGDHGIFNDYRKELESIKRSIQLVK